MRKVTIAVFAALALALTGVLPAQAEVRDDGLGTETASATQPESVEETAEEPTETPIEEKTPADCAAYVDAGWCDPGVDDYNCPQIDPSYYPIELEQIGQDPFDLDGDDNGWGCGPAPDAGGGDEGGTPSEEPSVQPSEKPGDCAHYAHSAAWCVDGVEDYDCPEIDDAYKPIELFDAQKDPFHLDRDVDAVGCEIDEDDGGSGDASGSGDGGAADTGGAAGTGGDGEQLPNTGGADLGLLWFAALAFVASGALLMRRRARAQQ